MSAINVVGIVGGEAVPAEQCVEPLPAGVTMIAAPAMLTADIGIGPTDEVKAAIISEVLSFHADVKIAHFTANSYNEHLIFGKLYDDLDPLVDEFVELLLSDSALSATALSVSTNDVSDWLGKLMFTRSHFESLKLHRRATSAVVDQMLAAITRAIYLLKLERK